MSKMNKRFQQELGINISSILLPKSGTDMKKWAVVACDQYTSEPDYWKNVENYVGKSPSTLHLIFPETYLERENDSEKQERIALLNLAMQNYLDNGLFTEITDSMIYIERTIYSQKAGSLVSKTRKGLVFAVDLEQYDFSKGSRSLIRATEGTILDRLPPRIRIRENACIEIPHIMLLIDDPDQSVIEPLSHHKENMEKLYSFDLMMDGGKVEGYRVNSRDFLLKIFQSLLELKSAETFMKKYNVDESYGTLLFAVGDGNHSLATAKSCWEKLKTKLTREQQKTHPARYALVELVNVHDRALEFEPIHRVLFNTDPCNLLSSFTEFYTSKGIECGYEYVKHLKNVPIRNASKHIIAFAHNDKTGYLWACNPPYTLDTATLQHFLDYYLNNNPGVEIDYVHGTDVTERLGRQKGNIGFFLSPMKKEDLFKTVILEGALPRKSFSMGEAREKRYYLEARKIV
jgi:uncharacterized protein (DUF1015 family)